MSRSSEAPILNLCALTICGAGSKVRPSFFVSYGCNTNLGDQVTAPYTYASLVPTVSDVGRAMWALVASFNWYRVAFLLSQTTLTLADGDTLVRFNSINNLHSHNVDELYKIFERMTIRR